MADTRPLLAPFFAAFGVSVTFPVLPTSGSAVTVLAIPGQQHVETPTGLDLMRVESRQTFDVSRADLRLYSLETVPRGTLLEGPATRGGENVTWSVEGEDAAGSDDEITRLVVVRA